MAIKLIKESGYGVVEFNNFSAQRDGRNKAQLPLGANDFSGMGAPCEQGMLLVYDEATGSVTRPTALDANVMLHKSEEKLYDPRLQALKNFALFGDDNIVATITNTDSEGKETTESIDFAGYSNPYPRLYQLDIGDTYTTNTVCYDDAVFADLEAIVSDFEAGTEIFGVPQVGLTATEKVYNGYTSLVKTVDATVKKPLKVIDVYTMPDGTPGIKFEVIPRA